MLSIVLDITQNSSSYIKSHKNDKMEKYIFVKIFKLTFVSFLKLQNLLEKYNSKN